MVAAYDPWQRPPDTTSQGDVEVLDVSKNALEKIRFQDGAKWLELFRSPEGMWLRQGTDAAKLPAPAADAGAADGGALPPPPPPPILVQDREMRANERADKLYERFTPLRA